MPNVKAGASRPKQTASLLNSDLTMNIMTQRADLLQKLFDPRRDLDDECGYPKTISTEQYRRMYDREMGRRVVNVYPEETWKKFPTIFEDPDAAVETEFEAALNALERQFHLLHYMQRADELSGVGHYGIVLWGLGDGKQLSEPVDGWEQWGKLTGAKTLAEKEKSAKHEVLYIRVLDESLVSIASYETDVQNPRYGLPTAYTVSLSDPRLQEGSVRVTPPSISETLVHWTRVSHVADNRKTSEVLGTPRMEPVWNRLYDLCKVLGGSGEMYWRGGFPGVSLETQPGLENAELDEDATREMMFSYMNGLQRYISLVGMSAKSLAPQIADPTSSFEVQVKAICIILGVPFRVFMGIEEGVVSGDQATQAWEGRLQNRQQRYVIPMIIDPILQRLTDYGVLPSTIEPSGWAVEWPDITSPSEKDRAEIASKKTEALAKYVAGGVDTLVPPLEFLTLICGLDDDTAKSIIDAAVKHVDDTSEDQEDAGNEQTGLS